MEKKEIKKYTLIALISFSAALTGVYTAFKIHDAQINNYPPKMIQEMYKMEKQTFFDADKLIDIQNNIFKDLILNNSNVKIEEKPKNYIITVNLKNFGNDEKNIKLKTDEHSIEISATNRQEKKNDQNSSFSENSFYQKITSAEKLDTKSIKKEKNGANLIITIPKKPNKK